MGKVEKHLKWLWLAVATMAVGAQQWSESAVAVESASIETNRFEFNMDERSASVLDTIMAELPSEATKAQSHGDLVERISARFLGTTYQAHTMLGSPVQSEALVVKLDGVDCMTFIDYVEALALSRDRESFLQSLQNVRYAQGKVDYLYRKHFFSDWHTLEPKNARDITSEISSNAMTVEKVLNIKKDGSEYVPGLGFIKRQISFIPAWAIDETLLDRLHNGDYIGVFANEQGLDVTHVGIVVKKDGKVWFRNASSSPQNMKVMDVPFVNYMRSKPGIVVLRAS